jgi:DNA-binding ferritin-like protein (Dps family)
MRSIFSPGGTACPALELAQRATATKMYADLIDLFEQSAASRTPIRQIVGEDPVEFIETFVRNYPKGQWIIRERERLTNAIERAAEEEARAV